MQFTGTLSAPAKVTVGGNPATVSGLTYTGSANVTTGSNTVAITATNAAGSTTHGFQVTVPAAATQPYAYDSNGNLLSDGSKTYQWDAANRLVGIGYVGNSDHTQMTYDGAGRRVAIVESTSGTVTGTKNFVWTGVSMAEERDASGSVTKRFFPQGEEFVFAGVGVPYYFARDHLGSVREMADGSGVMQARYEYDPYGIQTRVSGSGVNSDFGFTGHYFHTGSGVSLTLFREYDPQIGRWLNRDLIGEGDGPNLYGYVADRPISFIDRDGRWKTSLFALGAAFAGYGFGGSGDFLGQFSVYGFDWDKYDVDAIEKAGKAGAEKGGAIGGLAGLPFNSPQGIRNAIATFGTTFAAEVGNNQCSGKSANYLGALGDASVYAGYASVLSDLMPGYGVSPTVRGLPGWTPPWVSEVITQAGAVAAGYAGGAATASQ